MHEEAFGIDAPDDDGADHVAQTRQTAQGFGAANVYSGREVCSRRHESLAEFGRRYRFIGRHERRGGDTKKRAMLLGPARDVDVKGW